MLDYMECVKKALDIATKAHEGQKDKGGNDYIGHPIAVSAMCSYLSDQIVALLHDVVEDTSVTLDEIRMEIPDDEIIDAIDAMTRRKDEPREEYLVRVKKNSIARRVKIFDLTHNSDLSRIKNPTEKDFERVAQYQKEIEYLKSNADKEYVWQEIDYKLKEINPNYVPFELLSMDEQERLIDLSFDWDEEK